MSKAASVSETHPHLRSGKSRWFAVGALGVAAVAFLVISLGGIGSNLVYYWGPTEMKAAGQKAIGATIRLGGLVAPGSIVHGQGVSSLEFDVIDRQGGRVHVKASGVPPQMFRERIGVVVEGTLTGQGHFQGNRLMVSHSNEYRVPGEGDAAATEDLMRTTQDLDPRGENGSKP